MKALVLSGGGSKGAYEAGVLQHLLGRLGLQYEIVCGVSVGALNGAFLSQFALGRERAAAEAISSLWSRINDSRIYKSWFGWYLAALWKPSVYNSRPLYELMRTELDLAAIRASGRKLRVGAVSLEDGEYSLFGEDSPDLLPAVVASASFPGMLSPVNFGGRSWIDGGVRTNTPLQTAIDLGADRIDVIMCSPPKLKPLTKKLRTVDIAFRALDILIDEVNAEDVSKALLYNRLVAAGLEPNKRNIKINIVRPSYELTQNPLDFSSKLIQSMKRQGEVDAVNVFGD